MVDIRFKLFGVIGERAEKEIDIPNMGMRVSEIRPIVKKAFKIIPMAKIKFILNGRTLEDDTRMERIGIDPRKEYIHVMVLNPNP
jgi:hypothetical protein